MGWGQEINSSPCTKVHISSRGSVNGAICVLGGSTCAFFITTFLLYFDTVLTVGYRYYHFSIIFWHCADGGVLWLLYYHFSIIFWHCADGGVSLLPLFYYILTLCWRWGIVTSLLPLFYYILTLCWRWGIVTSLLSLFYYILTLCWVLFVFHFIIRLFDDQKLTIIIESDQDNQY